VLQEGAGTMSTTHSHSATSTMDRLASRVAQGGVLTVDEAFRQIAHHIHLLVHLELTDDTWRGGLRSRHVAEIRHVTGAVENGRPVTHLAYRTAGLRGSEVLHVDESLSERLAPFESGWDE
jgi:pilus assembly protein CpaF